MRDEDDTAAGEVVDEPLEPREAREVEVVGRLVEQQHVEAGEQDRRQRGAGRLAAGERSSSGERRCATRARRRSGRHGRAPRSRRRRARGSGRARRRRRRRAPARRQPRRQLVHLVLRGADAGAASEVGEHRLARAGLRLLRQQADGAGAARSGRDRAARAPPAPAAGSTCRSRSGRRSPRGRPARRPARRRRAPGRRRSSSRCHVQRVSPARADLLQSKGRKRGGFDLEVSHRRARRPGGNIATLLARHGRPQEKNVEVTPRQAPRDPQHRGSARQHVPSVRVAEACTSHLPDLRHL